MSVKKFWSDVVGQIVKAITPIPGELQKQYAFWESRKFSPEVNAKLVALQNSINPAIVSAILSALGNYKMMSIKGAEAKIQEIFDKISEILKV